MNYLRQEIMASLWNARLRISEEATSPIFLEVRKRKQAHYDPSSRVSPAKAERALYTDVIVGRSPLHPAVESRLPATVIPVWTPRGFGRHPSTSAEVDAAVRQERRPWESLEACPLSTIGRGEEERMDVRLFSQAVVLGFVQTGPRLRNHRSLNPDCHLCRGR